MNLILTHNNVRPIKYITTMCLGEIILYCPGYGPELLSLPTLRSTIGPLGSVGEPGSAQLNSQRARPHSSIRSGDSDRATHVFILPWCTLSKWRNLTYTSYAPRTVADTGDTEMTIMWSSQGAHSPESVRGHIYRALTLCKALNYSQEKGISQAQSIQRHIL